MIVFVEHVMLAVFVMDIIYHIIQYYNNVHHIVVMVS
jgi:hypothetical protein